MCSVGQVRSALFSEPGLRDVVVVVGVGVRVVPRGRTERRGGGGEFVLGQVLPIGGVDISTRGKNGPWGWFKWKICPSGQK